MNIAVFGTGMVGRALAERLDQLQHRVAMGTRDPQATQARAEETQLEPIAQWLNAHPGVRLTTYADAAKEAGIVINATAGSGSLAALRAAGGENLNGKVLLDVANPLDFSAGFPPSLFVANTDSLAEQIQRTFPSTRVVKSLNTMNCLVMVNPQRVPGDHNVFVAGEDAAAKEHVIALLREFGWKDSDIIDLGGLRAARGTEMLLPLWLELMQTFGSGDFNIRVVRA
jgi:hypothetical protein